MTLSVCICTGKIVYTIYTVMVKGGIISVSVGDIGCALCWSVATKSNEGDTKCEQLNQLVDE